MAKIAVIGLGYVGLPLAVSFAKAGFSVIGIENDKKRIDSIRQRKSYITDVSDEELKEINLDVSADYSALKKAKAVIICVPTPLRKTKEPDISYVISSVKAISKYMVKSQLIILESTTYPGTTNEIILPLLNKKNRRVGRDFFLAYSPERVDPGNKRFPMEKIPKIIAGVTPLCLNAVKDLYSKVFKTLVPVANTKVAETIKLLENTFRTVNIALVDEIAIMCHKMGINIWDVIEGASTKPFGFMPFYPGPGVGGACLPKDPLYLAWKAKYYNSDSKLIALASDITTRMPEYVVDRTEELLKGNLKAKKILILGVAYKNDIGDTRDSPSLEIFKLLKKKKANIFYNDPYVPSVRIDGEDYNSTELSDFLMGRYDLVIILTAHNKYDYEWLERYAKLIFDTRGIMRDSEKVVRL